RSSYRPRRSVLRILRISITRPTTATAARLGGSLPLWSPRMPVSAVAVASGSGGLEENLSSSASLDGPRGGSNHKSASPARRSLTLQESTASDERLEIAEYCKNKKNPSSRSEEHTSELQSRGHLVCRLL